MDQEITKFFARATPAAVSSAEPSKATAGDVSFYTNELKKRLEEASSKATSLRDVASPIQFKVKVTTAESNAIKTIKKEANAHEATTNGETLTEATTAETNDANDVSQNCDMNASEKIELEVFSIADSCYELAY